MKAPAIAMSALLGWVAAVTTAGAASVGNTWLTVASLMVFAAAMYVGSSCLGAKP